MRRALVLHGVPPGEAHPLLLDATRVVDQFLELIAAPPSASLLCARLHPRGATPRQTLEAALSTVLPVLAIVRR